MKRIRAIAVLPTLLTLGNLVCGFFAVVVASRIAKSGTVDFVPSPKLDRMRELLHSGDPTHNLMLCGALIFLAMLFDSLDGHVARLTRAASDFGSQLDSLCDVVSFGVAPAILLVKMCPQFTALHREAIWSIAALFACCAALRLARFNLETDTTGDHRYFAGLPSPAAAAVIAGFAMLTYTLRNEINHEDFAGYDTWLQRLLPPFAVIIALLMVSRVPYPHAVTQLLRGQRSLAQVVAIVMGVMVLMIVRWYAVPILCCLYVTVPALQRAWLLAQRGLFRRRLSPSKTSSNKVS